MLGPVRFNHIEQCTREACRAFTLKDELEDHIATLRSLDDILTTLRAELAATQQTSEPASDERAKPAPKKPDYKALLEASDVEKLKRLVFAREKAIKSVKLSLQKERDEVHSKMSGSGGLPGP